MSHMSIFGSTGSGKTGAVINTILAENRPVIAFDQKGDLACLPAFLPDGVHLIIPGEDDYSRTDIGTGINILEAVLSSGMITLPLNTETILRTIVSGWEWSVEAITFALENCPGKGADLLSASERKRLAALISLTYEQIKWIFNGGGVRMPTKRGEKVIVYLAHLPERERQAYMAAVLSAAIQQMERHELAEGLCIVIDEAASVVPPFIRSPLKDSAMRILRTGRAFGVSMTLASQSIGDLEYRAVNNAGTMMFGRLHSERDVNLMKKITGHTSLDTRSFSPGQFAVFREGKLLGIFHAEKPPFEWKPLSLQEAKNLCRS